LIPWIRRILDLLRPSLRPPAPVPTPIPPVESGLDRLSDDFFAAIVAARIGNGRGEIRRDADLDRIAREWAETQATSGLPLSHGNSQSRIASVHPGSAGGEDIAMGYPDGAAVVRAWLADPPHRKILLGPFNVVGVGLALDGRGQLYAVADFAQVNP
jgi:uncharacterized protein YkwD